MKFQNPLISKKSVSWQHSVSTLQNKENQPINQKKGRGFSEHTFSHLKMELSFRSLSPIPQYVLAIYWSVTHSKASSFHLCTT